MQHQDTASNRRIKIITLQSSSKGNSVYVESRGVGLLFDAGISASRVRERLDSFNIDISAVQGLFLSHEHGDHVRGAGPLHRKYSFPLYATRETLKAAEKKLKSVHEARYFRPGVPLNLGPFRIYSIRTPHDCSCGVCFIIESGGRHLGILTDIGKPDGRIMSALKKLDAAIFESNYDRALLQKSAYPEFVKKRISSGRGHLSNSQAAGMLKRCGKKLKWVCLAHISLNNNSHRIAHSSAVKALGSHTKVITASRTKASDPLYI